MSRERKEDLKSSKGKALSSKYLVDELIRPIWVKEFLRTLIPKYLLCCTKEIGAEEFLRTLS